MTRLMRRFRCMRSPAAMAKDRELYRVLVTTSKDGNGSACVAGRRQRSGPPQIASEVHTHREIRAQKRQAPPGGAEPARIGWPREPEHQCRGPGEGRERREPETGTIEAVRNERGRRQAQHAEGERR